MERFVKGDIVVIPFPFSNLSSFKKRPALVLADLKSDDIILCQITSQFVKDSYAIYLNNTDFKKGTLNKSRENVSGNFSIFSTRILNNPTKCLSISGVLNFINFQG